MSAQGYGGSTRKTPRQPLPGPVTAPPVLKATRKVTLPREAAVRRLARSRRKAGPTKPVFPPASKRVNTYNPTGTRLPNG